MFNNATMSIPKAVLRMTYMSGVGGNSKGWNIAQKGKWISVQFGKHVLESCLRNGVAI